MTALLLLHGFTGSPRNFQRVIAECPLGQRIYAPALLGHDPDLPLPDVEPAAGGCFEAEVDRLAADVEDRGLPPVHVIGYSLGARMALGLVVRHPSLVARATLVGVNPGLETDEERERRRATDQGFCALLERDGVPAFIDAWERQPLFATQRELPASLLEAQRQDRLRHSAAGLQLSLQCTGLSEMPNYWPALREIALPVDLVAGERDEKFSALARRAAAALPAARLHIVPEMGHNVLLERPNTVAAILRGG
jgi:2-succinyl-6-hydroxy-2,4-cyclohexadiene-1-carboxylate synthase